jgi:Uma2 family endonuclease
MAEAGLFDDHRVELINGRIYRMSPQHDPHILAVFKAAAAVGRVALPSDWVLTQVTYRLDKHSAPEPDVLWLPTPQGTPSAKWPSPVLLIEISHKTYRRDSGVKLRKYAEHGIADYWVVNVAADRVEIYREPKNPTGKIADWRYEDVHCFSRGQSIGLLYRPQIHIAVADLLP